MLPRARACSWPPSPWSPLSNKRCVAIAYQGEADQEGPNGRPAGRGRLRGAPTILLCRAGRARQGEWTGPVSEAPSRDSSEGEPRNSKGLTPPKGDAYQRGGQPASSRVSTWLLTSGSLVRVLPGEPEAPRSEERGAFLWAGRAGVAEVREWAGVGANAVQGREVLRIARDPAHRPQQGGCVRVLSPPSG